MIAKVIKVDPLKESRAEKSFKRVYFILETGKWAMMDIVPEYRNFKRWSSIIDLVERGYEIFVEGIILMQPGKVDADSPVEITFKKFEITKSHEKKIIQESLL